MAERAVMNQLAADLNRAACQHDWEAIQQLDQQIARLLCRFQGQAMDKTTRQSLQVLRHTHSQVHTLVREKRDDLAGVMTLHHQRREGALSYAAVMAGEDNE